MTNTEAPAGSLTAELSNPFRRAVADAVAQMSGADLIAHLVQLHDRETGQMVNAAHLTKLREIEAEELREQLANARESTNQMAADAGMRHHLLTGTLETTQHVLVRAGQESARAARFGQLLARIGDMADPSKGETVSARSLREVLSTASVPPPFTPTTISFMPSSQYSTGHFTDQDGAAYYLPFVGWSLYMEAPGQVQPHAAFLSAGEALPAPALYRSQGLLLRQLS